MSSPRTVSPDVAAPQTPGTNTADLSQLPRASSRLAHLLESNDVPLGSEIPDIRQIISDNKARMDALHAQIDVLRTVIKGLIAERDKREERVRQHTAVLAPVRRVLPELI
ncbi:hypothetical protein C8R44DRAFT_731567 [Mycena epipterygia]|nr:hypothetical protein C8R44DRAFT_731567 [Mycena epipterygia]